MALKVVSLVLLMSVFLFLPSCGQYGGLYLPNAKKALPVAKKTNANPPSPESVVESDTPP